MLLSTILDLTCVPTSVIDEEGLGNAEQSFHFDRKVWSLKSHSSSHIISHLSCLIYLHTQDSIHRYTEPFEERRLRCTQSFNWHGHSRLEEEEESRLKQGGIHHLPNHPSFPMEQILCCPNPDCRGTDLEYSEPDGATICMACHTIVEENAIVSSVEFNENNAGGASTVVGQFVGPEMTKVSHVCSPPSSCMHALWTCKY